MNLPNMLLQQAAVRGDNCEMYSVVVVQLSNFAAEQLVDSYIFDGWSAEAVHLKTGENDEIPFDRYTHQVSIITYGILWKWILTFDNTVHHPLMRYSAFFLDEFSDLEPVYQMAVRALGRLVRQKQLWSTAQIVAAGYGISRAYVDDLLGPHEEMLFIAAQLQIRIAGLQPQPRCTNFHSDVLGYEDEEQSLFSDENDSNNVRPSTSIDLRLSLIHI